MRNPDGWPDDFEFEWNGQPVRCVVLAAPPNSMVVGMPQNEVDTRTFWSVRLENESDGRWEEVAGFEHRTGQTRTDVEAEARQCLEAQ